MIDKKWQSYLPTFVVGCIGHDGAIFGRACGGLSDDCNVLHKPQESRGKRWRWIIQEQRFGTTLNNLRGNLEALTTEEYCSVIDWLIKNDFADEAAFNQFVKR